MKNLPALLALLTLIYSCTPQEPASSSITDPLPSWNVGATKSSITDFVAAVTDSSHASFIPVADRIAVFDNDGTLWSEQPMYFQLFFAMDRVRAMAGEHPEWIEEEPFKTVIENNPDQLKQLGTADLLTIMMVAHANNTVEEFESYVSDWVATARHPVIDRPYTELVYQPMLELLTFLKANDFKVFIVSGGGIAFMRPWTEEVYGIPRHQVVGSSIKTEFVIENGVPVIKRLAEVDFIDDKEGKPIGINSHIGRRPVFCGGNSDGDLAMMQWTAAGEGERFMLYVHHTDSVREWAYDRDSHIGQFDKGLDEALEKGWTLADMQKDWKVIYPFEME